eukprot:13384870-Alexandrium_andersonii.AAC.1
MLTASSREMTPRLALSFYALGVGGGESEDAEEEAFGSVIHYGSKQVCVRGRRRRCARAAAVAIPWSTLGGHQS